MCLWSFIFILHWKNILNNRNNHSLLKCNNCILDYLQPLGNRGFLHQCIKFSTDHKEGDPTYLCIPGINPQTVYNLYIDYFFATWCYIILFTILFTLHRLVCDLLIVWTLTFNFFTLTNVSHCLLPYFDYYVSNAAIIISKNISIFKYNGRG